MFFTESFCNKGKNKAIQTLYTSMIYYPQCCQFLQIVINPEAFGVWVPLAVGLGVGLIYALASMARRAR